MTDDKQHKALMNRLKDTNDRLDDQNKLLKKQNRLLEKLLGKRDDVSLDKDLDEKNEKDDLDKKSEVAFEDLSPEEQEIRKRGIMEARRQIAMKFP